MTSFDTPCSQMDKLPGDYQQVLEVATPTPALFQATAAMLLPGEVTATAWLPTCLRHHRLAAGRRPTRWALAHISSYGRPM